MEAVFVRGGRTVFPAASTSYGPEPSVGSDNSAAAGCTPRLHHRRSCQQVKADFLAGDMPVALGSFLGDKKLYISGRREDARVCCAARRQRIASIAPLFDNQQARENAAGTKQEQRQEAEEEEEDMEALNARLPPNHRSGEPPECCCPAYIAGHVFGRSCKAVSVWGWAASCWCCFDGGGGGGAQGTLRWWASRTRARAA